MFASESRQRPLDWRQLHSSAAAGRWTESDKFRLAQRNPFRVSHVNCLEPTKLNNFEQFRIQNTRGAICLKSFANRFFLEKSFQSPQRHRTATTSTMTTTTNQPANSNCFAFEFTGRVSVCSMFRSVDVVIATIPTNGFCHTSRSSVRRASNDLHYCSVILVSFPHSISNWSAYNNVRASYIVRCVPQWTNAIFGISHEEYEPTKRSFALQHANSLCQNTIRNEHWTRRITLYCILRCRQRKTRK